MPGKKILEKIEKEIKSWSDKNLAEHKDFHPYLKYASYFVKLMHGLGNDTTMDIYTKDKALKSLRYFESPFDFFPEQLVGPVGLLDDLLAAALTVENIKDNLKRSQIIKYWEHDSDLFSIVEEIIQVARENLPLHIYRKIESEFE